MISQVRKALQEHRRQLAGALASGLLDGTDHDIERMTTRLQAIDQALASLPAPAGDPSPGPCWSESPASWSYGWRGA